MDTSDINIEFNSEGVCNHCIDYDLRKESIQLNKTDSSEEISKIIRDIKKSGRSKKYDCIVGISGGIDSSYVAYLAKKWELRVLLVHLDNGWDSELAVKNVENIVQKTGFDLYSLVINWDEFKDLQRSFFKADVIDLELLSDHAIFASVSKLTRKYSVKYLLSGENFVTEAIMPRGWNWRKSDSRNIKAIHKLYGSKKLKTFPFMSTLKKVFYNYSGVAKSIPVLDYLDYNKDEAMDILKKEFDWKYYGGKHFESIFTRYYQGVILPKKFNIDKRRAHLSTLINSGQVNRAEALEELKKEAYSIELQNDDKELVCKKLGFSINEMNDYLQRAPRNHLDYKSDEKLMMFMRMVYRKFLKK